MKAFSSYAQDSIPDQILLLEKEITSNFLSQRNFQVGLEAEIGYSFAYPYDSLQYYFFQMKYYADSAILARMSWQSSNGMAKEGIIKNMNRYLDKSQFNSNCYQSTISKHQIRRIDAFEMIELVGKELYDWQERMMKQGRDLGEMKRLLDGKLDRKTQKEAYKKAYQPISSAESTFKQTQAYIVQLENLYSRFESANGESVYYFGPSIVAKPEQEAFQLTIDLLEVGQSEFDLNRKAFYELIAD